MKDGMKDRQSGKYMRPENFKGSIISIESKNFLNNPNIENIDSAMLSLHYPQLKLEKGRKPRWRKRRLEKMVEEVKQGPM